MKQLTIRKNAACFVALLLFLCFFLIPVASLAAENASEITLSCLEQIEPLVKSGPEAVAAAFAISRDEALALLERQRTGAKYFGGLTYGHSNEPVFDTSSNTNSYNKLNLTGGLNFPLLGTWQKEKVGKLETETAVMQSQHHAEMLALDNLVALRKAYATLWIEQQKEEISERFLTTEEEAKRILQARQTQGLVLPVDSLEYLSSYQDARRDTAASKMRQAQALEVISLVTGHIWDKPGKLTAPSLPNVQGKQIDLDNHPVIVFQSRLVSQYEKLLAAKSRTDREATLNIGVTATRDFPGETGKGAYIAFSTTEPFKAIGSQDQAKLAAADDLKRVKIEEAFIRLKLDRQVGEAIVTADYAASDVNAQASHLIVQAEDLREKMLRRQVLPGDTFEQLLTSKLQYYRTALAMLEREEVYLHSAIDIASLAYPKGLAFEPAERVVPIEVNNTLRQKLLSPGWLDSQHVPGNLEASMDFFGLPTLTNTFVPRVLTSPKAASTSQNAEGIPWAKVKAAVYVWDAQPFLQEGTRTMALDEVVAAGFSRVLISFTPGQISELATTQGKSKLEAMLAEAKGKGLRIDLLLGDPNWAETAHRQELITLIKKLQGFAFDGIHLDIEPDMLSDAPIKRAELLKGVAETVQAVKSTTGLPVSLAIHPRYLEGDLGIVARQKLLPLGLEEVVVMIYSNNPEATAQRMAAIIAANPKVTFSLAQSVEKSIPQNESYAACTRRQFTNAMRVLENKLAPQGLKEIVIQAWEDYK